jgi:hypothetical protein
MRAIQAHKSPGLLLGYSYPGSTFIWEGSSCTVYCGFLLSLLHVSL